VRNRLCVVLTLVEGHGDRGLVQGLTLSARFGAGRMTTSFFQPFLASSRTSNFSG
jgi:hypothetical protein